MKDLKKLLEALQEVREAVFEEKEKHRENCKSCDSDTEKSSMKDMFSKLKLELTEKKLILVTLEVPEDIHPDKKLRIAVFSPSGYLGCPNFDKNQRKYLAEKYNFKFNEATGEQLTF